MARPITIITGGSRGMGLAIALRLVDAGHSLLSISRKSSSELAARAATAGTTCEQWMRDLSDAAPIAQELYAWLAALAADTPSWTLINNAGVLPRIAPLAQSDAADLVRALRVDLEAPMLLASAFLRATAGRSGQRRVLNISSGLGRNAMASQTAYCAAKAGMDHFTRCLALEEAAAPGGARVCSLAPGVIDTDMQLELRSAPAGAFSDVATFIGLKERGALTAPDAAAARIIAYLERADFGAQPVADVRGN